MTPILNSIAGDPGRNKLESRIYNALTFFTPLATIFVIPIAFILDLSVYHIASVFIICIAGFYMYYLSRFRKIKSDMFLIYTGLILLSVIWITGYGSLGYDFLFFQFIMLFSLLVLEKRARVVFFFLVFSVVLVLVGVEYSGITVPKRYYTENERILDFLINFSVWFVFTGLIIKVIIDNFRLERQQLDDELRVAQKLQRQLLPQSIPEIPGYSLYARYLPMTRVGGDFYDCKVTDETLNILIADVSGHGLPGAFLSTVTKIAFEHEIKQGLSSVLTRVNKTVLSSTVDSNFVTAFFCSINRSASVMKCYCAGHFPAIIYRRASGDVDLIKPKGKPLGWLDDPGLEEMDVNLFPGDRLVLYTDGITECSNGKKKLFGTGAFIDFIKFNSELSPPVFCEKLITLLRQFSGADFFDDDITLIIIDKQKQASEDSGNTN